MKIHHGLAVSLVVLSTVAATAGAPAFASQDAGALGLPEQDAAVAALRASFEKARPPVASDAADVAALRLGKKWKCDDHVAMRDDFTVTAGFTGFKFAGLDVDARTIENAARPTRVESLSFEPLALEGRWNQTMTCRYALFIRIDSNGDLVYEWAGRGFMSAGTPDTVPSLVDPNLSVISYGRCTR